MSAAPCATCGRPMPTGADRCRDCGRTVDGARYTLVLADGTRAPLRETITIGRAPENTVVLDDGSVSRRHAQIVVAGDAPVLEDAGSRYGTFLDGERLEGRAPLHDGARIELGDAELRVERECDEREARGTVVVRVGERAVAAEGRDRPRLRGDVARKRLDVGEGARRYVLRDLRTGVIVRMTAAEAALIDLLDGRRTLRELLAESERRLGSDGPARLGALLADLGERGLLERVEGPAPAAAEGPAQLLAPRTWPVPGAGRVIERVYRAGGRLLLTRPALVALGVLALAGLVAFSALVVRRDGVPLVVADQVAWGALVFILGRFALVGVHELAHGLALTHAGRTVERAGFKLVLVFPYAFVDTSSVWLEPRRRRLAITAAGPASDFTLGGLFALGALAVGDGALRDVLFQVAFGGYVGALVNLNPVLDRDGYHLLVDWLREPGLRGRARTWLRRRLAGAAAPTETRLVAVYAAGGLLWSVVAVGLVALLASRYAEPLERHLPAEVVSAGVALVCALMLLPVLVTVLGPLLQRRAAGG